MKLITFRSAEVDSVLRPGLLLEDGQVLDPGAPPLVIPAPENTTDCCDRDGAWLAAVRRIHDSLISGSADLEAWRGSGALRPSRALRLGPPVPRPGKIICIGLNYRDHAAESGMEIPGAPLVFSKFSTAVIGPEDPVIIPSGSERVDFEAELGVVIGRRASRVPVDQALDCVLGYLNFNDVSARDFQFADGQWQRGKSCDTFAPMGPFLATADEIPDPQSLAIGLHLNGDPMQGSNTDQMIFGVADLVAYLSAHCTLEPGDLIATGTPPGVGFARTPPVFVRPGDVMEVAIEGLGILRNPVTARPSAK